MKTAHQLAHELLAGPDLPISHFDPSFADACDEESNYTHGEVIVEIEDPAEGLTAEELADLEARGIDLSRFITLSGDQDPERDREALTDRESKAIEMLRRYLRAHALKTEEQELLRQETYQFLKAS